MIIVFLGNSNKIDGKNFRNKSLCSTDFTWSILEFFIPNNFASKIAYFVQDTWAERSFEYKQKGLLKRITEVLYFSFLLCQEKFFYPI